MLAWRGWVVLALVACSQHPEPPSQPATAAAVQSLPPATPADAQLPPVSKAPVSKAPVSKASEDDKNLVIAVAMADKSELDWTSPTGERVDVEVTRRLDHGTWHLAVVANGAMIDSIDTHVADGDHQVEAGGSLGLAPDGILVIAGAIKAFDGFHASWDAHVLAWAPAQRRLIVVRRFTWEQTN